MTRDMGQQGFDPRLHSMVNLVVTEKAARKVSGTDKTTTDVYEVKSFTIGPHAPKDSSRIQSSRTGRSAQEARLTKTRPASASASQSGKLKYDASPLYLDNQGHWVAAYLPSHPLASQSQALSVTTKRTDTTLSTRAGPRSIRPVAAVHAYLDNSPITTAEFVQGPYPEEPSVTIGPSRPATAGPSRPATAGPSRPATAGPSRPGSAGFQFSRPASAGPVRPATPAVPAQEYYSEPRGFLKAGSGGAARKARPTTSFPMSATRQLVGQQARAQTARAKQARSNVRAATFLRDQAPPLIVVNSSTEPPPFDPSATELYGPQAQLSWKTHTWPRLGSEDISRISELGRHAVPGSAQTRLIGGRWRYVPRPVDGDVVFTDYYGPVGGGRQQNNYYGRSYHNTLTMHEFSQNKLVEDTAYQRVQASMAGIATLRNRPGLAVDTTIVHAADPQVLHQAGTTSPVALGLHHLKAHHNIKPSEEYPL